VGRVSVCSPPPGFPKSSPRGPALAYVPKAAKPKKLFSIPGSGESATTSTFPVEKEWGSPPVGDHPSGPSQFDKVYQMFGAGDQLDVMTSLLTDRAGFLKAGISGRSTTCGVDEYVKTSMTSPETA